MTPGLGLPARPRPVPVPGVVVAPTVEPPLTLWLSVAWRLGVGWYTNCSRSETLWTGGSASSCVGQVGLWKVLFGSGCMFGSG